MDSALFLVFGVGEVFTPQPISPRPRLNNKKYFITKNIKKIIVS
jgi:hypothetical protein